MTSSGMDISKKCDRRRQKAGGCDDDGEGQQKRLGASTASSSGFREAQLCEHGAGVLRQTDSCRGESETGSCINQ